MLALNVTAATPPLGPHLNELQTRRVASAYAANQPWTERAVTKAALAAAKRRGVKLGGEFEDETLENRLARRRRNWTPEGVRNEAGRLRLTGSSRRENG